MNLKKTLFVAGVACNLVFASVAFAHSHTSIDHSHRSDANQKRDEFRQPFRTLEFFGVKENHKVVEIHPGGGWYTEVLAPLLKDKGQLVAAHYPTDVDSDYRRRSRKNFEDKMKSNDVYSNVTVASFDPNRTLDDQTTDADVVLTFRGLHGLQNSNDLAAAFDKFNAMLKTGGSLGVVQHQAPEGHNPVMTAKKGYLPKSHVISVAQAAGFDLVAEAYFHNNPKDRIIADGVEGGVWTLPPGLRTETDKEKFRAVGESNRMTLLFKKR